MPTTSKRPPFYELLTEAVACRFKREKGYGVIDNLGTGKRYSSGNMSSVEVSPYEYHKYDEPVLLFEVIDSIRFVFRNASRHRPVYVKKHIKAYKFPPSRIPKFAIVHQLKHLLSYGSNACNEDVSITIDENFRERAIDNLLQCTMKIESDVQDVVALQKGVTLNNGRYVIKKVLGNGGFAITYLATDNMNPCREVVVKELFMQAVCRRNQSTSAVETLTDAESRHLLSVAIAKFVGEAEKIKDVVHPNIVKVFDTFEDYNTYYYTMEYLPNGSLDDLLSRGPINEEVAVGYIKGVADGLAKMHSMNMLHLDIKPSNILLGNNGEAVIIDFGSTKRFDSRGIQCTGNPLVLSNGFAAPELVLNKEASCFSPKADVYALGVTLFVMLTNKLPIDYRRISGISSNLKSAIKSATLPFEDRLCSVDEFVKMLDDD